MYYIDSSSLCGDKANCCYIWVNWGIIRTGILFSTMQRDWDIQLVFVHTHHVSTWIHLPCMGEYRCRWSYCDHGALRTWRSHRMAYQPSLYSPLYCEAKKLSWWLMAASFHEPRLSGRGHDIGRTYLDCLIAILSYPPPGFKCCYDSDTSCKLLCILGERLK